LACCKRIASLLNSRGLQALDVFERHMDGRATTQERIAISPGGAHL
jgi:hypothetical protein